MQKYGIERTSYETVKMKEFARQVLSNDASSVVNLMERMHAFVVPLEANITNLGPFSLLANAMQVVVLKISILFKIYLFFF